MARTTRTGWGPGEGGPIPVQGMKGAKPRHCGCCCSEVARQGRRKARHDAKAELRRNPEDA